MTLVAKITFKPGKANVGTQEVKRLFPEGKYAYRFFKARVVLNNVLGVEIYRRDADGRVC